MSNRIKCDKPLPCPFCGGTELNLHYTMIDGNKIHYITCKGCGANGGIAMRADFALTIWNNRVEVERSDKE